MSKSSGPLFKALAPRLKNVHKLQYLNQLIFLKSFSISLMLTKIFRKTFLTLPISKIFSLNFRILEAYDLQFLQEQQRSSRHLPQPLPLRPCNKGSFLPSIKKTRLRGKFKGRKIINYLLNTSRCHIRVF